MPTFLSGENFQLPFEVLYFFIGIVISNDQYLRMTNIMGRYILLFSYNCVLLRFVFWIDINFSLENLF